MSTARCIRWTLSLALVLVATGAPTARADRIVATFSSQSNSCRYVENSATAPQCALSGQLVVSRSNGQVARKLIDCPFSYTVYPCALGAPSLSPDGETVAVSLDGQLVTVSVATGQVRPTAVPASLAAPAWSPDGRRIATVSDSGLRVSRPDGSLPVLIASSLPAPDGRAPRAPAWIRRNGRSTLFYVAADGDLRRTSAIGGRTEQLTRTGFVQAYTVAADGRVVYVDSKLIRKLGRDRFGRLLTIAPGAKRGHELRGVPVAVTPAGPSLSPDGQRVLYSDGRGALRLHRLDKSTDRPLLGPTATQGPFSAVTWSPDGRAVISAGSDGVLLRTDLSTRATRPVLRATSFASAQAADLSASLPWWNANGRTTRPPAS